MHSIDYSSGCRTAAKLQRSATLQCCATAVHVLLQRSSLPGAVDHAYAVVNPLGGLQLWFSLSDPELLRSMNYCVHLVEPASQLDWAARLVWH